MISSWEGRVCSAHSLSQGVNQLHMRGRRKECEQTARRLSRVLVANYSLSSNTTIIIFYARGQFYYDHRI